MPDIHIPGCLEAAGVELDLRRMQLPGNFESDYGAAPKVEMPKGQVVTNIAPDFAAERWVGIPGEIIDEPFLPICRSQIDVRFECDSRLVAQRTEPVALQQAHIGQAQIAGVALRNGQGLRRPLDGDDPPFDLHWGKLRGADGTIRRP